MAWAAMQPSGIVTGEFFNPFLVWAMGVYVEKSRCGFLVQVVPLYFLLVVTFRIEVYVDVMCGQLPHVFHRQAHHPSGDDGVYLSI